MILDSPSRPRRRPGIRALLALGAAAAVVVVILLSAAGERTRTEIEYWEEIRSQSVELSRSGQAVRDVMSRLQRIDRTLFVTAISGIREDLDLAAQFAAEDPLVDSLRPVRALYREALDAWESGIVRLASAVLTAADDPDNNLVIESMAGSLAELRAGDGLYADLASLSTGPDVPDPVVPLPEVSLMPAEGDLVTLSTAYVDSARSETNSLAMRPGLALSEIQSDPEWVVNTSDEAVIPATEEVSFAVVVTNVGNVVAAEEELVLTLAGGDEPVRLQESVEPLASREQVAVDFGPVTVRPGTTYEVRAVLVVAGDDVDLEDNELVVRFRVNEG